MKVKYGPIMLKVALLIDGKVEAVIKQDICELIIILLSARTGVELSVTSFHQSAITI